MVRVGGAGRVRHTVDWVEAVRLWFSIFGVVGVVVTIMSVLIKNPQDSRATTLWLLGATAVVSALGAVWANRVPTSEDWLVPQSQDRLILRIRKGDLLGPCPERMSTLITMNRRFGLRSGDVLTGSLIRQLADRTGGVEEFSKKVSDVTFDCDRDLPLGTFQDAMVDGRSYLLLAATTAPTQGESVSTLPLRDIWPSLERVWTLMRTKGLDIRMPVLGSGRSGSSLGHELLMAVIAVSLVGDNHEHPQPTRTTLVEVVVSPDDWAPPAVKRFRSLLRDLGYRPRRPAQQARSG